MPGGLRPKPQSPLTGPYAIVSNSGLSVAIFLDPGGSADLLADVVELGAPDETVAEDFHAIDPRRVEHEAPFYTN